MSPSKRVDIRPAQRWSVPDRASASRHGREHLIVRWIGAANLRDPRSTKVAAVDIPDAQIVRLSWADTFGRPTRIPPARLLQFAGAVVPLLSF